MFNSELMIFYKQFWKFVNKVLTYYNSEKRCDIRPLLNCIYNIAQRWCPNYFRLVGIIFAFCGLRKGRWIIGCHIHPSLLLFYFACPTSKRSEILNGIFTLDFFAGIFILRDVSYYKECFTRRNILLRCSKNEVFHFV